MDSVSGPNGMVSASGPVRLTDQSEQSPDFLDHSTFLSLFVNHPPSSLWTIRIDNRKITGMQRFLIHDESPRGKGRET
jgi:hypothetical protein